MDKPFELIQSTAVFRGRVFDVRRDEVRLPDGRSTQLDIVEHSGAVVLVPVDRAGQIWLVRQYRYAAGEFILELPAGTLDDQESPDACARREIREEIGLAAGQLFHLGQFYLAPGYSTELMHVYLATELTPDPLSADDDEFLAVESMPVAELYERAERGQIHDAKTLAALLLARPKLLP